VIVNEHGYFYGEGNYDILEPPITDVDFAIEY
jgi:hypothetical protein